MRRHWFSSSTILVFDKNIERSTLGNDGTSPEIKKKLDENDSQILEIGIFNIRSKFNSKSNEIYTNISIN